MIFINKIDIMVKINGKEVKNRTEIEKMVNDNSINDVYVDDIKELNNILKIKKFKGLSIDIFLGLCKFSYLYKRNLVKIVLDLDNINETFELKRYEEYLKYRVENKYKNNLHSFVLKYGEKNGNIKYNNVFVTLQNKSPYKIEYWVNKGFTENEAKYKIIEYKRNKSTSLDGFINRHGFTDGVNKFNKFQNTSKHTMDKYIELYGEDDGIIKWNEYVNKKAKNSVFKTDYWVNKGYSETDAEEKRKQFHTEKLNTSSVQYWINRGLSEEEANAKIIDIYNKRGVKFRKASKASLKIFNKVINEIEKENISYCIGINGNNELSLYSNKNKKRYYYDFTIPDLKLIFEYHGEKFHPHHAIQIEEDLLNWTTFYLTREKNIFKKEKITGLDIRKKDEYKKQLAIDNGYKYFIIWSSDDKEEAIKNIINIINLTKNENKKNN